MQFNGLSSERCNELLFLFFFSIISGFAEIYDLFGELFFFNLCWVQNFGDFFCRVLNFFIKISVKCFMNYFFTFYCAAVSIIFLLLLIFLFILFSSWCIFICTWQFLCGFFLLNYFYTFLLFCVLFLYFFRCSFFSSSLISYIAPLLVLFFFSQFLSIFVRFCKSNLLIFLIHTIFYYAFMSIFA